MRGEGRCGHPAGRPLGPAGVTHARSGMEGDRPPASAGGLSCGLRRSALAGSPRERSERRRCDTRSRGGRRKPLNHRHGRDATCHAGHRRKPLNPRLGWDGYCYAKISPRFSGAGTRRNATPHDWTLQLVPPRCGQSPSEPGQNLLKKSPPVPASPARTNRIPQTPPTMPRAG